MNTTIFIIILLVSFTPILFLWKFGVSTIKVRRSIVEFHWALLL
jgi:hypothetical protein